MSTSVQNNSIPSQTSPSLSEKVLNAATLTATVVGSVALAAFTIQKAYVMGPIALLPILTSLSLI